MNNTPELTKSKIEFEGVQVTFEIRIGDWHRRQTISPIDYEIFKKWNEIYGSKIVENLCKDIDYAAREEK